MTPPHREEAASGFDGLLKRGWWRCNPSRIDRLGPYSPSRRAGCPVPNSQRRDESYAWAQKVAVCCSTTVREVGSDRDCCGAGRPIKSGTGLLLASNGRSAVTSKPLQSGRVNG